MKRPILVAPSILSADFARLDREVKKAEDAGSDMLHIDVMDGCFVPNITIGPFVVAAIRKITSLPLDVHLMIESPHRFIKDFSDSGSDIITIHAEAYGKEQRAKSKEQIKGTSKTTNKIDEVRIREVLSQIKSFGKKAGLSLNPDSPFCIKDVIGEVDLILIMSVHPGFGGQEFIEGIVPKIKEARKFYSGDIEVDGGINDKNVRSVIDAGANVIVAGSYFFNAGDKRSAIEKLKLKMKKSWKGR